MRIFCCCFCCWVLVLLHCDQIECSGLFLFSYICWDLLCALRYDLFWRKFHGLLNVYCAVVRWNILCTTVRSIWFMVSFSSRISLLMFYLDVLCIDDRGVLTSPTTTVLESVCAIKSFSICLMKLGTLTLGAYRLIIVISFWLLQLLLLWSVLLCLIWPM
jgi:hypothetical protein